MKTKMMTILVILTALLTFPIQTLSADGPVYNLTSNKSYLTIQQAIDDANESDTIRVDHGTYHLSIPVIVDKSLTLTGDTNSPQSVSIWAPVTGSDRDCFQVLDNEVTIEGFQMLGAQDTSTSTNSAIAVGNYSVAGINDINISSCHMGYCSFGIFLYRAQNVTVSKNKIWSCQSSSQQYENGIAIVIRGQGSAEQQQTSNINIHDNELFSNTFLGIRIDNQSVTGGPVNADILINNNLICNNGGPIDHIAPVDSYCGISSTGNTANVTIRNNRIYGHVAGNYSRFHAASAAIRIGTEGLPDTNWTITANTIHDNFRGVYIRNATDIDVIANHIYDNAQALVIEDGNIGQVSLNIIRQNNVDTWSEFVCGAGFGSGDPNGCINLGSNELEADYNYWGHPSGPGGAASGSGDTISANVSYKPYLAAPPSVSNYQNPCPLGDLDGDCDVDFHDFAFLAASWPTKDQP
jgi:nitrous oxidase accessory protein NosD